MTGNELTRVPKEILYVAKERTLNSATSRIKWLDVSMMQIIN